ncbi:afadin [Colossoma macropomum]|uniref:afadin n=1 Tax=Colossoma macropomum TaxID=42526 RepID=UPI001863C771|nr:afadin [Colossoma macropomum]
MAHFESFASMDNESILTRARQRMERETLQAIIRQWNSERLDLFEISEPDEDLVFHGIMRFYLQDHTAENFATKCIRVSSTSTTQEIIETLLEKFRPDVSIEPHPYSMYDVCGDEEGRRLDLSEKPLIVQLGWNKNTTEGRFILKYDSNVTLQSNGSEGQEKLGVIQNFKRTLSKKQKTNKQKKKESINTTSSEIYDLASGNMNRKNNHEQKKGTMDDASKPVKNPEAMECCVLRNEEVKSEDGSHKSLPSPVKPAGRTQCTEQPNKRGIFKSVTPKQRQTFEPQNGSTVPDNSRLKWNLPLSIKLGEKKEEAFLLAVVNYTNSSTVHFKLSPAYAFYLASRFVLGQSEEKNKNPEKTAQRVTTIINKIVHLMDDVIQKQRTITVALTFWMANASEFLNFIRQDRDLSTITVHSQTALAQLVQKSFTYLSHRLLADLESHLPTFVTDAGEQNNQTAGIDGVLATFTRAMSLLRRFRVNPALSIQLFSQLFHFMGAWLLNRLTMAASGSNLCSHYWGMTLRQRLYHVEAWAERQGLELAADCHLSRIIQATTLLTMNSYAIKDTQKIHSTCFKLNSLQLRALMSKYHYAPKQPHIPHGLIESVVAMAESTENEVLNKEGRDIRIEEDLHLHLPFLLPEEGYSCEILQGIPKGFQEFLEPMCHRGLCKLIPHCLSLGSWTVYFKTSDSVPMNRSICKPEIVKIVLKKPLRSGTGISIVAAKGAGQEKLGIFIKSVVRGGAADVDGRLAPGDQLLSVDDGADGEQAMQTSSGLDVNDISKQIVCAASTLPGVQGNHHTAKKAIRKQDQKWLKHRLEYRSNPNLAYVLQNSEEMSVDSVIHEQITSVSTDNIIAGKQARSQENLSYMDRGGPLVDRPLNLDKWSDQQTTELERRNIGGPWNISAAPQSMPVSQPKRIDVPLSHPTNTLSFGTFRRPVPAANSINLKSTCLTPAYGQVRNSQQISALHSYHSQQHKGPTLASKQLLQSYISTQKPGKACETMQAIVCESFPQNTNKMSPSHSGDTFGPQEYKTVKKSDVQRAGGGLCPDPWKREAREQLKKQQRHQAVNLLEQEVLQLQAKVERTLGESERLRRLSLEWQFQKRLQEFQQNGEDNDEEEDEDNIGGTIMKQTELKSNEQSKAMELHNGQKLCESQAQLAQEQTDHPAENSSFKDAVHERSSETNTQHVRVSFGQLNQEHKNFKNVREPENLTFRERQQLFSLTMNEPYKVKVS